MSGRPVYVPSRKRKTKQQRFHGAFTGGFSAGYFNTVGSAEGWTPRHDNQLEDEVAKDDAPVMRKTDNNVPGKPKSSIVQRREDFMDEQDHNEWGGPTGVKKEFDQSSPVRRTADPLLDLVSPPSENLGHRLLRALGWRDGSTTAYVADDGTDEPTASGGVMGNSAKALLSKRRLKKITLQQNRVQIPPPKQDTCGVGYQTYHDAPEFQRDRVRRQRLAQERAKAVTASQASNRNVYRVANVLGEGSDDDVGERSGRPGGDANHRHETTEHDGMTSYETVQDFVGTKTVGGFALREDDDDVYDDHHTQNVAKVNLEEYDTVLYDNHDSDVDDNDDRAGNGSIPTKSAELGTVLESWATSGSSMVSNDASSRRGRTSDGRPPLTGFVMGGTTASSKEPGRTRFPGPDMPLNYEVKRHVFRPDEPTGGINFEARDEQFQKMENRRKMAAAERRARAQELNNERTSRSKPMASAAFAGLAAAMKDRFTASEPESVEGNSSEVVGLQRLRPTITNKTIDAVAAVPENKELKSVRSVMTFAPESLLCKRLHVTAPSNSKFSASSAKALPSSSEASFFELEVLSSARKSQPEGDKEDQQVGRVDLTERPSMALLTSIFDADMEFEDGSPEEVMEDRQPTPSEPIVSEVNEPLLGHETGGVDDERSFASNAKIQNKTRYGQGEMKRRIDMIRSPSDAESSTKYGRMRSLRRTASSSEDDSVPATEHKRRGRRTREKKKRKTRHKSVRTGSKRH